MNKNSSFYNERINNTNNATKQVCQTTEQLKKEEEELIARLQKTYASEKQTIQQLNATVKKSPVKQALGKLRTVPAEDRKSVASELNQLKKDLESQLTEAANLMAAKEMNAQLDSEWMDLSMPGVFPPQGARHPLTEVERRCMEVLRQLGFDWVDIVFNRDVL